MIISRRIRQIRRFTKFNYRAIINARSQGKIGRFFVQPSMIHVQPSIRPSDVTRARCDRFILYVRGISKYVVTRFLRRVKLVAEIEKQISARYVTQPTGTIREFYVSMIRGD